MAVWFLAGAASPVFGAGAQKPERINALVIGMSYSLAPREFKLENTVRDAELVAAFLKRSRSNKTTLMNDPDLDSLSKSLEAYIDSIDSDEVAFVYYAGHGIQIDGSNYIVASRGDAVIPLSGIIERVRMKARTVVVILDACRNNPLRSDEGVHSPGVRSIRVAAPSRDIARGLKRLPPALEGTTELGEVSLSNLQKNTPTGLAQFQLRGPGVKVVFSTDPGNVAADAEAGSANSPFTASLVRNLIQRKSLDEVLADVTREVFIATAGRQTPWVQGSAQEAIYLSGPPGRYDKGDVLMPLP